MSNYTQEQETEIVRDAMTLTAAIQIGENELKKQQSIKFKSVPPTPRRQVLTAPTIKAKRPLRPTLNYKYTDYLKERFKSNSLRSLLLLFIFWGWYLIYEYFMYQKKWGEMNKQLDNDPEYLAAIGTANAQAEAKQQKANEETAKKQAEIDAQYKADLEYYNTVVIPEYNQEHDDWKAVQKIKIEMLEEELQLNRDTLEALYESTRIISLTYRKLEILRWLYDDMSTSDHDIRYATELLDRDRQREVTLRAGLLVKKAVDEMHSSMISGFNAIYDAVDAGNVELARMHRDQNLANTIGIIQRHNLNKMIKTQNGILERSLNR